MSFLARLLVATAFVVLGFAAPSGAAEQIRAFHADIDVHANGKLSVTEKITVNAEGTRISRGIFRDIPLRDEDAQGKIREVGLDVVSVLRDGRPEPFATERSSGVLRIRIGDGDVRLTPGVYTYEIAYDTTRQIRFFDDHDELYWNVTGNAWEFPIRQASAQVTLPRGAKATDVTYYTGRYGSREQDASARMLANGNAILFQTTRPLSQREGLTVVVAFPKGVVAPPSAADESAEWWRDNAGLFAGGFGLLVVTLFYLWAWRRVGRDPPEEIVVPRWTAPDGVSPALANYIEKRGFRGEGWDAFSASIIDLAVKGHLEIEQPGRNLTIRRKGEGTPAGLGVGQRAILNAIPHDGDALAVDKAHGETVQAVGTSFRQAMETEHRNKFYRHNPLYIVFGLFLSVVSMLAMAVLGAIDEETLAVLFMAVVPSVVIAIIAVKVGRSFRSASSLRARIMSVLGAAFVGFIGLNMLGGVLAVLTDLDFHPAILGIVAGMLIVNLLFFLIMGAPTPIGQKLSAQVAGLKQYLTLAEKDRMNMQGAPTMSPQHFETLLPYAVALGVEKPWSRTFDAWLASAAAAGAAAGYVGPSWYHGSDFGGGRIGKSLGDVAGSLASSLTASLPAPKSSSSGFSSGSGGGGFSGGGGGGGGGGGW